MADTILPFNVPAGISSGGDIAFSGAFAGTTGAFSKLLTASGGLSAAGATFSGNISAPNIVNSVNGITAGVSITAGTNITLTQSANIITIAASSGGGASTNSTTQTLDFSENNNGYEIIIWGLGDYFVTSLQHIENNKTIVARFGTAGNEYSCTLDSIESFYDATNGWSAKLILTSPFTDTSSLVVQTAEWIYDDGGLPGNIYLDITSNLGVLVQESFTNIINFSIYNQEETYVTKTVTGLTWVAADSYITCNVLGLTTADHTPEDAILEGVKFNINNIVAGTGFDIIGHAPEGTYGKYTVKCLGQ